MVLVTESEEAIWAENVINTDLHACGCGLHEERLIFLRESLRDFPLYENERWRKYDYPLGEWFLCLLEGADLIEHGTSISGSWLTEKGTRLRNALNDKAIFAELTKIY